MSPSEDDVNDEVSSVAHQPHEPSNKRLYRVGRSHPDAVLSIDEASSKRENPDYLVTASGKSFDDMTGTIKTSSESIDRLLKRLDKASDDERHLRNKIGEFDELAKSLEDQLFEESKMHNITKKKLELTAEELRVTRKEFDEYKNKRGRLRQTWEVWTGRQT